MTPSLSHNSVLYTYDMEPITVIQLRPGTVEFLARHGHVTLAVHPQMSTSYLYNCSAPAELKFHRVTIAAEVLRLRDKKHLMLFTHDEESALLLKSAFLPGQQREVQEVRKHGFAAGFLDALTRVGGV